MESSRGRRMEKRGCEESLGEEEDDQPNSKKQKLPGLASVIVEALKVDSLQRLCSSLEPLFRRIVSEEVERALTRLGHAQLAGRSSPPKIQCPEGKSLQLRFTTRMPPHLFTGGKVEGEQGAAIHVVLQNACTGCVVQTGPESSTKLNVVVLEGDFNEEPDEDWSEEHFEGHEVKEREGKQPLLTGELQVTLKEGLGTLGDLTFTDNSSWIRSRKFRLGVKVAPGTCPGLRVREAKTEAFAVKDHRGELYKKHYPPALHDEVWRLDRIAKDGALHKKLIKADVITVEDFLRVLVKDQQRLRTILGSGMSNRMWENTVEHAKTCVLGGKLYVYYADGSHGTGIVFNHIYELRGLIADGQFIPLESLTHSQKISVDSLVKGAYENWSQVIEYDGKVLTALPNNNSKGTRALPVPASDIYHSDNVYVPPTQSRQQCNNPTELSPQFQAVANNASVPNLIEFPLVRSEATPAGGVSSSVQALPSSMDYTPAFGASTDWASPREGQAFGDFFSEEIRLRSTEMLESDDMQRLLRNYGVGVSGGIASPFGFPDEGSYNYVVPSEHQVGPMYERERRRGSGKAVVGWLKLKAALRWGIFVRKKAAERRAQLIELD